MTTLKNNVFDIREVLQLGIEIGIKTALNEMEKKREERFRTKYDRRLRNTRLLLENYHAFIKHCNNAVYEKSKMSAIDILDDIDNFENEKNELVIESIKRSKERTYIMIEHINKMIRMYKVFTEDSKKPEEVRKYKIIVNSYISERRHTNEEMASKMHIDVRSVQRDKSLAIEQLTVFLFGVDGLKML
jgi:hypothetical protein